MKKRFGLPVGLFLGVLCSLTSCKPSSSGTSNQGSSQMQQGQQEMMQEHPKEEMKRENEGNCQGGQCQQKMQEEEEQEEGAGYSMQSSLQEESKIISAFGEVPIKEDVPLLKEAVPAKNDEKKGAETTLGTTSVGPDEKSAPKSKE